MLKPKKVSELISIFEKSEKTEKSRNTAQKPKIIPYNEVKGLFLDSSKNSVSHYSSFSNAKVSKWDFKTISQKKHKKI